MQGGPVVHRFPMARRFAVHLLGWLRLRRLALPHGILSLCCGVGRRGRLRESYSSGRQKKENSGGSWDDTHGLGSLLV
jgi:hypothetical protein